MIERTVEVLIDDDGLSLEELASACAVSGEWIERHVQGGLLGAAGSGTLRFTSVQLLRARRLADIERIFEANDELAALVVDLIEEVERLRGRG
ncbi:MAG TPA: MerR family transcriptional regulator [Burkholderiaceae bacterium]|nr:MerR family transcriptional regulator [Burkholderiaceae bacterium]